MPTFFRIVPGRMKIPGRYPEVTRKREEMRDGGIDMIAGKTAVGVETREIEWLWKPFVAFGKVTMLQGDTGVGKTSLMVKIVADCTNGLKPPTQFHGQLQAQEKGEPLTTFYVTTENGIEDTLIPMFDLYGGNRRRLYYQDEDEGHFVLNGDEIRAAVEQFGARLIVIDPWQEFLADIASTSNEKLRAMIRNVQKVAEETGTAIVLCGNFSKARAGSDLNKGLGGAELANTLRSLLTVSADPYGDPHIRVLKTTKMSFIGKEMSPVGLKQEEDYTVSYIQWQEYREEQEKRIAWVKAGRYQGGIEADDDDENDQVRNRMQKGRDFLLEELKDGPMDSRTLYEKARKKGISRSTLNRAKPLAGAYSKQRGNRSSLWKIGEWD